MHALAAVSVAGVALAAHAVNWLLPHFDSREALCATSVVQCLRRAGGLTATTRVGGRGILLGTPPLSAERIVQVFDLCRVAVVAGKRGGQAGPG